MFCEGLKDKKNSKVYRTYFVFEGFSNGKIRADRKVIVGGYKDCVYFRSSSIFPQVSSGATGQSVSSGSTFTQLGITELFSAGRRTASDDRLSPVMSSLSEKVMMMRVIMMMMMMMMRRVASDDRLSLVMSSLSEKVMMMMRVIMIDDDEEENSIGRQIEPCHVQLVRKGALYS